MAAIKQLKVGSTNYDIKALNATNNNTADFVVRDIKYGTAAPSGGSAGQVYLQYDASSTSNLYVYAEDTAGSNANVVDNYYSKSEVDAAIASAVDEILTGHNYSWTGTWSNSSSVTKNFQITGKGFVICNIWARASNANDTGSIEAWVKLLNSSNSLIANLAYSGNRLASANAFQMGANAASSYYYDGVSVNNRLQFYASCSKNNTTNWKITITTIGCTLTEL